MPIVSVVMSVFNGERDLRQTVETILGQSFRDFEFIIVNDGSQDSSREILAEYERTDGRVLVIEQDNCGITRALIHGCAEARGQYIARIDAGDSSKPRRLQCQVNYLDEHPEVAIVGCWFERLGPGGELLQVCKFPDKIDQATQLFWSKGLAPAHSSAMFRRSVYEQVGGYRTAFRYAQDHDLFYRMAERAMIGYYPEILLAMVLNTTGITATRTDAQRKLGLLARKAALARRCGESEAALISAAEQLSLSRDKRSTRQRNRLQRVADARTAYFVGSMLLQRSDPAALQYLRRAIALRPFHWTAWWKFVAASLRLSRR